MKQLFLFLLINSAFCILNSASAQAPLSIPYQAVARDSAGNFIANQNISLRFSIHDVTANGTIVYKETQTGPTSGLGLFSANVGQGTVVTGSFASIAWGNGAKFIQVEMDATGGNTYVNMGTQQMLSVPYALFAGNAGGNSLWNANGAETDGKKPSFGGITMSVLEKGKDGKWYIRSHVWNMGK